MASEKSGLYMNFQEYLKKLPDPPEIVKAGLLERKMVRKIAPNKLYPNPDDEFSDPSIGPNSSIITNYAQIAKRNYALDMDVYSEPIIVAKLKSGGYMILNGHHRWAGALRACVPSVIISITNNI